MQHEVIPVILLIIIAIAGLAFFFLHWRYHPEETPLDSFEVLKERLDRGKPAIIQFHAPL